MSKKSMNSKNNSTTSNKTHLSVDAKIDNINYEIQQTDTQLNSMK
jgi:hypothetical protein